MKTKLFRNKFGALLGMLVILAMLGTACSSSETPSAKPQPPQGGNQPPVISSLTPAQTNTPPSGSVEIQVATSDPDGDKVNVEWACSGGNFALTSSTSATWDAPPDYGDYDITVTADDGKSGSVKKSVTISVVSNQPPQVSVDADPKSVMPNTTTTITCHATDPNGDDLRYSWSAPDGEISGVGEKVTWRAPNRNGTFEISVVVSDGKGAETTGRISITAAAAIKTVTFNVIQEETGTVSSVGDKDTTRTRAGDNEKNEGYNAFWSFNIYSLVGTDIKEAKLEFTTKSYNDEIFQSTGFGALNGLKLWEVKYGEGGLPNADILGGKLDGAYATERKPPTIIDVTPEVTRLAQANGTRFQVKALFNKITNGNDVAEWIEWSNVTLTVTYSDK